MDLHRLFHDIGRRSGMFADDGYFLVRKTVDQRGFAGIHAAKKADMRPVG
jgi:hypothetical protein